jgi:glyoxylase-like metal-dependent hydrolase (beta-lactamase superfamily II)
MPSSTLTYVPDGHILAVASELFDSPTDDSSYSVGAEHGTSLTDVLMSVGAFLLRGDGHNVLIDLGWGPTTADVADLTDGAMHGQVAGGGLLPNLGRLGVDAGEITHVYFSHLHGDHVGWLLDPAGRATFPNARYVVPDPEWRFWTQGSPPESFTSPSPNHLSELASRKLDVNAAAVELPVMHVLPLPGHTPGHSGIAVIDGSTRVLVVGDAVHCPAELAEGGPRYRGNLDRVQARESLSFVRSWVEQPGSHLACGHVADDPFLKRVSTP